MLSRESADWWKYVRGRGLEAVGAGDWRKGTEGAGSAATPEPDWWRGGGRGTWSGVTSGERHFRVLLGPRSPLLRDRSGNGPVPPEPPRSRSGFLRNSRCSTSRLSCGLARPGPLPTPAPGLARGSAGPAGDAAARPAPCGTSCRASRASIRCPSALSAPSPPSAPSPGTTWRISSAG